MKYFIKISPVQSNQSLITKFLIRHLGEQALSTASNLVRNGGVVRENLTKAHAEQIAGPLRNLGAQVEVIEMSGDDLGNNNPTYEVKIINYGSGKLAVVKAVKETTGLGLKQAKELVDKIGEGGERYKKDEADRLANILREAGAEVEVNQIGGVEPDPEPEPEPIQPVEPIDNPISNKILSQNLGVKTMGDPIAFNEKSFNVSLLHQALDAMGIFSDEKEIYNRHAGPDTSKKVRQFQQNLKLPTNGNVILVNELSLKAIYNTLKERGLFEASRSFTVTGKVISNLDKPVKQIQLLVFDMDLTAISTFRSIKYSELEKLGEFRFLASTLSNNCGEYRFHFYDWQFLNRKQKIANLVIFAVGEIEKQYHILGYSNVVHTNACKDSGLARNVDIIITSNDARPEYEKVVSLVNDYLKNHQKINIISLGESPEQLTLVSSELDLEENLIKTASIARKISAGRDPSLRAEFFYGISRQNIRLDWEVLFNQTDIGIREAIDLSTEENIIKQYPEIIIDRFIKYLKETSAKVLLEDEDNFLNKILNSALPKRSDRLAYLLAYSRFSNSDSEDFWESFLPTQPEFKNKPQLVKNLILNHQLSTLTGYNAALINELQMERKVKHIDELFDLEKSDWLELVKKTEVVDRVSGESIEQKQMDYSEYIFNQLNATFPTKRILRMVDKGLIPIGKSQIKTYISKFLKENVNFDFAKSSIYDFKSQINSIDTNNSEEVFKELCTIQRVFQVSPDPDAMASLMKQNLNSASKISEFPTNQFLKHYADSLGGIAKASSILQKAQHITSRNELFILKFKDVIHNDKPRGVLSKNEQKETIEIIKKNIPNYSKLFGRPDICECHHCRSVFSPAAYLVDLLRFLERSKSRAYSKSCIDVFKERRPDLLHLPLTCENSNTLIPYIDLANEIMEYFTANKSLNNYIGYNTTSDTPSEELRATPQNFKLLAYKELKDAKFPFSLPYHQPLDVIRQFSRHFYMSRYEVMKAVNLNSENEVSQAIAAESLHISEEEFKVITGYKFDGSIDQTESYQFFGFENEDQIDSKLSSVPIFIDRSGISYQELIELLGTNFVNPTQNILNVIEKIFSNSNLTSNSIYQLLEKIKSESLNSSEKGRIATILEDFNNKEGFNLTFSDLENWTKENLDKIQEIITLFEPNSKCSLETTRLRTIKSIYKNEVVSGLNKDTWNKMQRFIRLWRKLGWTIDETDTLLQALSMSEIKPETIQNIEVIIGLQDITNLTINEISLFWGNFDINKKKSLYKKLFLNKANPQINQVFKSDAFGEYLQNGDEAIVKHLSSIISAFKIKEQETQSIMRLLGYDDSVGINLFNLSAIYRHVLLAKSLQLSISDLIDVINIFGYNEYIFITPTNTFEFCELIADIQKSSFTIPTINYIFNGKKLADSENGLSQDVISDTKKKLQETIEPLDKDLNRDLIDSYIFQYVAELIGINEKQTSLIISEILDEYRDIDEESFTRLVTIHHRAAEFIKAFKLSDGETKHLVDHPQDFENIDFSEISQKHWTRVNDYVNLRNKIPQKQATLLDVFTLAHETDIDITKLIETIHLATAWRIEDLTYLIKEFFGLETNDFKNEKALNKIEEVMNIISKTGLTAKTITTWGKPETDFDKLFNSAKIIRNAVKAKYEDTEWLSIAAKINNKLRENQQMALSQHLLTLQEIRSWGATNEDGLFEYFLIDVQMKSCMETSRIVQANSSIQMFVNRILLNLEEPELSPDAIDKDHWEWKKNYRVWEANRKTFVQAENYLEPEWRNDRSELFKELESYLTQNDISNKTAEQAMRGYVNSLDEISNLDVCGMHREQYDNGKLKYLHVFARTNSAPYKFFYRKWDEFGKWTAWEKVPVDIRSIEANSNKDNGGVQLAPVIWKNRIFLFWPEFSKISKATEMEDNESFEDRAGETINSVRPNEALEIKLAWSEYTDGKWTPKQIKDGPALFDQEFSRYEKDYSIWIFTGQRALHIYLLNLENNMGVVFSILEINSIISYSYGEFIKIEELYDYNFNKKLLNGKLIFNNTTFLKKDNNNKLLSSNDQVNQVSIEVPFFYSSSNFSYFVKPYKNVSVEVVTNTSNSQQYAFIKNVYHDYDEINILNENENFQRASFGGVFRDVVIHNAFEFEFHTFYHPFTGEFVERLNKGGIKALLESGLSLKSDEGEKFINDYDPNFNFGGVKEAKEEGRTYYKENVCFDTFGANSLYNWELFFHVPLYIATRLSKNGRYEEAMKWFHHIYDPTTSEPASDLDKFETSRYWKILPFKSTESQNIEDWFKELSPNSNQARTNAVIGEWRNHPFDPHRVAANRPIAYMQNVVVKYVENLLSWGDSLFRKDTMESVNEALQLYVLANHILGPRSEFIPKRGTIKAESYNSLLGKWDDFSNARVVLENIFPYSSEPTVSHSSAEISSLLSGGSSLYFCIPSNLKLLDIWNTVADRLFKIRNCQNIEGVKRSLSLFAPIIDPAMIVQAKSRGLSLTEIFTGLSVSTPLYRFSYLLQKANEFCNDVKSLGGAFLSALEKKDGEELNLLRSSHENQMLEMISAIRERGVLEAKANKEGFIKSRETAVRRLKHYVGLLGIDDITIPPTPTLKASLNDKSQLPSDINVGKLTTTMDLANIGEGAVKLISKERFELDKLEDAQFWQIGAQSSEALSAIANIIPNAYVDGKPLGVGVGVSFGGRELGAALSAAGRVCSLMAGIRTYEASEAAKIASYFRRTQDWTFQGNMAIREIVQLDKQITTADIRIQLAQIELENHKKQIEHTAEMEQFLKDKFTNQELYQWMKEQIYSVYKQAYNLAFDMAKKAEEACQNEFGLTTESFINYGYWESSKQGLVAGEKLQLALRQLEKYHIENNSRDYEITKHISLSRLNPFALIEFRKEGNCIFEIPEVLFDMDFPGQYFRRIKSVSISIPCVAGPHTSVSAKLSLINNRYRKNDNLNSTDNTGYIEAFNNDERFISTAFKNMQSITTSNAQNDSGVFELNFRDERYLPFEYAGAISKWNLELPTKVKQFDYNTISDVIVHIKYTSRDGGTEAFKEAVNGAIKDQLNLIKQGIGKEGLHVIFSIKHDFPNQWHLLKQNGTVDLMLDKSLLPYMVKSFDDIKIESATFNDKSLPNIQFGETFQLSLEDEELSNLEDGNLIVNLKL
ncbi:ribosomal protein L7/L12 [Lunatibacter salilacus]|uniref:ribosomal protein L7/L12 n=1 Tax=Lunatibacter salilacus TaxID=2483804 RepID=UPI00131BE30F|nr:ribosomal protein L7/L12 [Lunatibacter salilacus]